jgi:hypothetical protein
MVEARLKQIWAFLAASREDIELDRFSELERRYLRLRSRWFEKPTGEERSSLLRSMAELEADIKALEQASP